MEARKGTGSQCSELMLRKPGSVLVHSSVIRGSGSLVGGGGGTLSQFSELRHWSGSQEVY